MKKFLLASCLVAGTSLGAGIIALPMVLCKVGVFGSVALIVGLWFFMYLSGLLGLELNLRAQKGLTLSELGTKYSGFLASQIGSLSLLFLIYALLCAYLYGGASIFQSFFEAHFHMSFSLKNVILTYAALLLFIWSLSTQRILYINKALLLGLLGTFGLLIVGVFAKIKFADLPFFVNSTTEIHSWTKALPILSTAFGFQVILPTLTNFCDKDPDLLKRSIFWGSFIPMSVYIIWTLTTICILYHYAPSSYTLLMLGKLDVGQFTQALTDTTAWPLVKALINIISIIAILKSSIGVGLALVEFWQEKFGKWMGELSFKTKGASLSFTLLPPLAISLLIPSLFLRALSFAGMINVVIVFLLPLWLLNTKKASSTKSVYPLASNKVIQILCLGLGLLIIICEFLNL